MANLNPLGIDLTSGQVKPLNTTDVLTTSAGGSIFPTGTGIVVLTSSASAAEINTALTNYRIVYLTPGTYSLGTTIISIPAAKQLIGITNTDDIVASGNAVYFTSTRTTSSIIFAGEKCTVQGINVVGGGAATSVIGIEMAQYGRVIECGVTACGTGIRVQEALVSHCHLGDCETVGGIDVNYVDVNDYVTTIEYCSGQGTSQGAGIRSFDSATFLQIVGCRMDNYLTGYDIAGANHVNLLHCYAVSNAGDGFSFGGNISSHVFGCWAESNGAWGFDGNWASAVTRAVFHSNFGRSNTSGNFNMGAFWNQANSVSGT